MMTDFWCLKQKTEKIAYRKKSNKLIYLNMVTEKLMIFILYTWSLIKFKKYFLKIKNNYYF